MNFSNPPRAAIFLTIEARYEQQVSNKKQPYKAIAILLPVIN